jgi:predicted ATPase
MTARSDTYSLQPGTRFGNYEILVRLGKGGMGEVYRARDTRLGREVAIKVLSGRDSLPPEPSQLERFEREARAASALNHPNIVSIYELGQVDSTHYIAMELVEGKTLRQLLASGGLPIQRIVPLAAQIADGLAKAHEARILHRDLKPENLMVSADGFVKILDFGLAKIAPREEELAATLAGGEMLTSPGTVMGTVGYMSPEQASGRTVDFRSDQFSFGLVLYEMATGRHALGRRTPTEMIAAILRDDPEPLASLNPEAPAPLCWVAERCLAKDPEKRYASTHDIARDLAAIRDRLSQMPQKAVEARPSNLPAQRTAFVGRKSEVAAATDLLLRDGVRLLTITGPGGIGKTRLGLKAAETVAGRFPGGVYFVNLAATNDPGMMASFIAQTLGLREAGGQAPLRLLEEHFQNSADSPMLLLLDNFEHLMGAAPLVAELLAMGPALKIVVTSRAALHVYGEHEFPVAPLALPDPRSLPPTETLSNYSAIELFVQRAAAVKPGFQVTAENAPAVAEICARLDGLPLAIELAAARIKLLPPSAMRTRLESRLQLLTGGARDLPARQRTLRGAIDWSYGLLSEPEQKLLRRLSVFVGGCTLEAAEAVCDTKADLGLDLLDGMASMVDKSLAQQIESATGESRFVLLETIREYGLEKLAESGEEAQTRQAHAAYCLVLAEELAAENTRVERTDWLNACESENDNFRAALDWLSENGNPEWGLRLATALYRFWSRREMITEGRDRLGKVLRRGQAQKGTRMRARALFAAGVLAYEQGDLEAGNAWLRESLEISRALEDKRGMAVALNALASNARSVGDVTDAKRLFEESRKTFRELNDPVGIAGTLNNMAGLAKEQGDYARAHALYEESLSIFQSLGDRPSIAWLLSGRADVARAQEDFAAARSLYERSLATFREIGDPWGAAVALADLGDLLRDQRDFDAAHALYRGSLETCQATKNKRGIARLLECFAGSAAAQGRPKHALRLAGAAAALRKSLGTPGSSEEQARLERSLQPARQTLSQTDGTTAWLEGWELPVERAIEQALSPGTSDS